MKSHLALIDDYNTYYTRKKLIEVEMEDDPRYIKQTFIKHYRKDTNKYIVDEAGRTRTGHFLQLINPNFRSLHHVIEVHWKRI